MQINASTSTEQASSRFCFRSLPSVISATHRHAPRSAVPKRAVAIASTEDAAPSSAASTKGLFVAANNFKVKPEYAENFENMWKSRESFLHESPGFIRFALLRCDTPGEYISQTMWERREDFQNWTKSQQFSKAHGDANKPQGESGASKKPNTMQMLEGPPAAKLYEAVTTTEK